MFQDVTSPARRGKGRPRVNTGRSSFMEEQGEVSKVHIRVLTRRPSLGAVLTKMRVAPTVHQFPPVLS